MSMFANTDNEESKFPIHYYSTYMWWLPRNTTSHVGTNMSELVNACYRSSTDVE